MNWYKISKKWVDRLHGGKADDKTPDDFPKEDVERGRRIEREHSSDPDIAREISLDHLCEHKNYYSGLEHMENLLTELEQEEKKDKSKKEAGSARYRGQMQGDEHQQSSDVFNERMMDNKLIEGPHVEKLRRMIKEKDWTNFNIYVAKLKSDGFSHSRINSMISSAGVGVKL